MLLHLFEIPCDQVIQVRGTIAVWEDHLSLPLVLTPFYLLKKPLVCDMQQYMDDQADKMIIPKLLNS